MNCQILSTILPTFLVSAYCYSLSGILVSSSTKASEPCSWRRRRGLPGRSTVQVSFWFSHSRHARFLEVRSLLASLALGLLHFESSVADPGCLSRIPNPNFWHPESASKNFSILTQKNMIRVVHSGFWCWFFTRPRSRIQGSKRHRIPGSKMHRIPDRDPQHCFKIDDLDSCFFEEYRTFFYFMHFNDFQNSLPSPFLSFSLCYFWVLSCISKNAPGLFNEHFSYFR